MTSILNGINKKLERTKFQYQYIKGTGERWPYTVQFFFDQETLEYFDEKIKAILTSQYHDAVSYTHLDVYKRQVYGLYDNLKSKREQDELLEVWKI